jgi:UDP-GlcNAc:undecaprenyl-phosphate GlcNAc-1-phosphate transferase
VPFPFNVYLLGFAAGFLASLLSLPLWRAWSLRVGLVDDPGHRKIHATPTPLAGGLAIMTGLLLPLLLAVAALQFNGLEASTIQRLGYGMNRRAVQLAAILIGAVGMVLLGWWDDKHELRPAAKFAGQLLIATVVAAAGVRITLFVESRIFSYAITILWILTVTNAFNFIDNMNGLCAGLGSIAAMSFALTAAIHGQYLVAGIAFLSCGAMLGFLPFNFPRATAFLGDAGSHLIGFLLAVLAILPHFYSSQHPKTLAVFSPLLILGVPLADLVWVVLLRWQLGKPFYVGDTNHVSHRLVQHGLSSTRAVLLLWLLAVLLCSLCLLLG